MPSIDLRERVAIVTGGAQGIGLGIARVLRECGARVVVNDVVEERAREAAASLGGDTLALCADVSDERAAEALVEEACRVLGGIDVLVNNAGIGGQLGKTVNQKTDVWQRVLDVDLRGPYVMAKSVGRRMCEAGRGSIVNVASIAGLVATAADVDYGVAKAGLIHMTKALALDFARFGVRVNCVAPGFIETPLATSLLSARRQAPEDMAARIPIGRIGQPDDIARVVAFLVSDLASYVTGACVPVDGGVSAGTFPITRR